MYYNPNENNLITYDITVSPYYKDWESRFARCVDKTLNNPDSWSNTRFMRVKNTNNGMHTDHPDIIISLSTNDEIMNERINNSEEYDIYGNPVKLSVTFYTQKPINIMINGDNYINAVPISKLGKKEYRKYVINHEVGHALGFGHLPCDHITRVCPVMYQMTKGVPDGYEPNFSPTHKDYYAPILR